MIVKRARKHCQMPYIEPFAREVAEGNPTTPGELNFAIHKLIQRWLRHEAQYKALDYATWNTLMGVLECVKQEIYRRKIAPYEEAKLAKNGDVW